jgi:hypothetical protein
MSGVPQHRVPALVRASGLVVSGVALYFVLWLLVAQPGTVQEITGGVAASVGAYRIDDLHFADGRTFFLQEQYPEARAAFQRADPAQRDAVTQFYVAYTYYRQGWGRLYSDDTLFTAGLAAVDRAIALSRDGRVRVEDPDLGIDNADQLRAELVRGTERDLSDLNPFRVFRKRK